MKKYIFFIFSDQHNSKVMNWAGDSIVRTPHMNRLANGGTAFMNAYTPSPLCVPCRSAMLSTLLPTETGAYTNFNCLRSDQVTFVHSLGLAGYRTVLAGRMHFNGPDQRQGFQERLVGDITPNQVGGPNIGFPGGFSPLAGQNIIGIQRSGPGSSTVIKFDEAVRDAACDFVQNLDGNPHFMTIGLYGPHCPFIAPQELYDYYYDKVPLPVIPEGFKKNVHPAIQNWYKVRGMENPDEDEIRRSRAAYYSLVELTDGYIGQILKAIEDRGILDDSLIIYATDHGDMIGDNGLFWKSNFYEGSARVPLIFYAPGKVPAGRRIHQNVSLLDLGPTLIQYTEGPALPRTQGENLMPLIMEDKKENPDRAVISICGDVKGDAPSAMIRKGDWKLIQHHGYSQPQLFNLKEDPAEQNDLGGNPDHEIICKDLLEELAPFFDGEKIVEVIKLSQQHTELLKNWNQKIKPEVIDQWIGEEKDNYLSNGL